VLSVARKRRFSALLVEDAATLAARRNLRTLEAVQDLIGLAQLTIMSLPVAKLMINKKYN
jgi:hypothetical protein